MSAAATLAGRLGLDLRDPSLLHQALVHSSYLHEHPDAAPTHNERLEFLGDAVVNLAISQAVYLRHPDDDEGLLSARRAAIVSTVGLARLAARISLGDELLLGEGEASRGGRRRAIAARVGLRGGVRRALPRRWATRPTRDWLLVLATPELERITSLANLKSPKSRLQERTQQTTGERPHYRVVDASGPDHEKTFRIEVAVNGRALGWGVGPSRRIAETAAAEQALDALAAEDAS